MYFLCSAVSEKVAHTFLSAMIPLGSQILSPASEGIGFSELMVVMAILSGAGSGSGHMELFVTTPSWLERWYKYILSYYIFIAILYIFISQKMSLPREV